MVKICRIDVAMGGLDMAEGCRIGRGSVVSFDLILWCDYFWLSYLPAMYVAALFWERSRDVWCIFANGVVGWKFFCCMMES